MKVLLIVLLAGLAAESSAAFLCKPVVVLEHFSFAEFAEKYYQFKFFSKIENFASWIFGNCTQQTYTLVDDDVDKLLIENSQIDKKGNEVVSQGYAVYQDPSLQNGVIKVTVVHGLLAITLDYYVLVFRPGKYIIVYSCILGLRSGWVLTREKFPSEETRKLIDEDIIRAHECGGPSLEEFNETPQTGCHD